MKTIYCLIILPVCIKANIDLTNSDQWNLHKHTFLLSSLDTPSPIINGIVPVKIHFHNVPSLYFYKIL